MRSRREPLTSTELLAAVAAAGFGERLGDQENRDALVTFLASLPGSPDFLDWIRARRDAKRFGGPLA